MTLASQNKKGSPALKFEEDEKEQNLFTDPLKDPVLINFLGPVLDPLEQRVLNILPGYLLTLQDRQEPDKVVDSILKSMAPKVPPRHLPR